MVFVTLLICGVGSVWPVRGFDGRGGWILGGFVAECEGYTDSPSTYIMPEAGSYHCTR
jgi:hypothetical protein